MFPEGSFLVHFNIFVVLDFLYLDTQFVRTTWLIFCVFMFEGDCKNCIHLWEPSSGGTWNVDTDPFVGHTASVEDLQVSNLLKEEANDPGSKNKIGVLSLRVYI